MVCKGLELTHEVAQGVLASLSVDLYDRMQQAARNNFEKALEFLDPLGWIWKHGLAQHLARRQDWDQSFQASDRASESLQAATPRQERNPPAATLQGSLDFLIVDADPDVSADDPNASSPSLGACVCPCAWSTGTSILSRCSRVLCCLV